MRYKILIQIIFLFIFATFRQHVLAQDVLGQSVSKDEFSYNKMDFCSAIKYSLENNNNIRAMKKGLSASERDIGIARSSMMPKGKFVENFTVTNNPIEAFAIKLNQTRATASDLSFGTLDFPGVTTNFLTSLIVEQKILDKKSMVEIKMAKKEYSENGYIYLRKQEDLVNQVAQAYVQVNTNQELVKVAEEAFDDIKEHLGIAENRYKVKSGLSSDILRLKSSIKQKEEELVTAQRNLNVSMRNLGLLLGLEIPIETSNDVPEIKLQDMNYYKQFSIYRNDIKAMEIRVGNAKNNISLAQSAWYPTLSAFGSYNFYNRQYPFGGQGNNYIAGTLFKWDVFDGNKRKYEILKAKDKEAEAKEYLIGLRKEVNFKVYEAYTKVEEIQRNLELAIESEKEAEENETMVEKSWTNSNLPLVSLIDSHANQSRAKINVVKYGGDLKQALINLFFESGIICQELRIN